MCVDRYHKTKGQVTQPTRTAVFGKSQRERERERGGVSLNLTIQPSYRRKERKREEERDRTGRGDIFVFNNYSNIIEREGVGVGG